MRALTGVEIAGNYDAFLQKLRALPVNMRWSAIKFMLGGMITRSRLHETADRGECIYGCQGESDSIQHYCDCGILYSHLDTHYGTELAPMSRLERFRWLTQSALNMRLIAILHLA